MKRAILAAVALAVVSLAAAPAFADEPNLKSSQGIKKFWEQHHQDGTGG